MPYKLLPLPDYPAKVDIWEELKNESRPIMVYGMGGVQLPQCAAGRVQDAHSAQARVRHGSGGAGDRDGNEGVELRPSRDQGLAVSDVLLGSEHVRQRRNAGSEASAQPPCHARLDEEPALCVRNQPG